MGWLAEVALQQHCWSCMLGFPCGRSSSSAACLSAPVSWLLSPLTANAACVSALHC